MTAIEASSVSVKTMADNTLRLTVDIEPRHAKQAFALFGERGTAMALAALKTAQQDSQEAQKGGPLARWAAMRCQEPEFRAWMAKQFPSNACSTPDDAAQAIRTICGVDSRAELDSNPLAQATFDDLIRLPWRQHIGD